MNVFKDLMRVVALFLIVRAVYTDSVACAISAGTLYLGGFDTSLHIKQFLRSKLGESKPEAPKVETGMSAQIIQLRRS